MTIQCDQCHTRHDVDPPAWVVSSGKPFRFRCSACGHSQSVTPGSLLRDTPLPPALIDTPPPVERDVSPDEPTDPQAARAHAEDARRTPGGSIDDGVFLKQNGQIYMVRDWQTLSRWIVEKRVDADDLVSEGGVRWEAIGSRSDLAPLFAAVHPAPAQTAFPFGGLDTADVAWNDDDTEGVPTGLPPLPTEERAFGGQSPLPPALLDEDSPILERSDHSDPEPAPAVVDEDEEDTDDSDLVQPTPPTSRIREGPPPVAAGPDGEESIDAPRSAVPLDSLPPTPRDVWRDLLTQDEETETQSVEAAVVSPLIPLAASPKPVSVAPVTTPLLPVPEPSPAVEEDDDDEWMAVVRSSRRRVWIGAGVFVVAVAAMAWIGWMRAPVPDTTLLTTTPVIEAPAPPLPVPMPVPVPAVEPAPAPVVAKAAPSPKPTPKPTVQPTPKPAPKPAPVTTAPKPAPAPAPAPASGESAAALAKRGWELADTAPAEAEKLFVQALSVEPTHDDANYGYGYLLLQRSKVVEAAPYLCRARRSKSSDIRQDVNGLIATHGVACP